MKTETFNVVVKFTAISLILILISSIFTAVQKERYYRRRYMTMMEMEARHLPDEINAEKLKRKFGITIKNENLEEDSKKEFLKVEPEFPSSCYCCMGKIEGTTVYCIFRNKEPIAAFDFNEPLIFTGTGGICLGEKTHTAYAIFYESFPQFNMKIIKLNVKEVENVASGAEILPEEISPIYVEKYPWIIISRDEYVDEDDPEILWYPILRKPKKNEYYFVIPCQKDWAKLLEIPDDEFIYCSDFDEITVEVIPVIH